VFFIRFGSHFAHTANPLYQDLRKREKSIWIEEHSRAMKKLKKQLFAALALRSQAMRKEGPFL
jgi:hypothetical protein